MSQGNLFNDPTSLQEGSHASLSVLPGSERARLMTVTSGQRCCELLKRSGPLGSSLRTLLTSSRWNSTMCWLIWKPLVTPRGRLRFQLAVSVRHTDECGSGFLLTPSTEDHKSDGPKALKAWREAAQDGKRTKTSYQQLRNQVM